MTAVGQADVRPDVQYSTLRLFHPGWFAGVMGTGIVATAGYLNPGDQPGLLHAAHVFGVTFAILTWLVAVAVAVPYLLRLMRYREAALADLRHPVVGALYATLPAAVIVLGTTTATVGGSVLSDDARYWIVAVLAAVGGLLAFAVGVLFTYTLFVGDGPPADAANGGWFMPPVVSILVPLVLVPLLPWVDAPAARLLVFIGYAAWGIGFFLFLLVAAAVFHRLVFHPLPPAGLAPSIWIGLGPIGVGSLALLRLGQTGDVVWGVDAGAVAAASTVAAAALWGFGLWWLATAVLTLRRYLRAGPLPYGVGWWAFTFPLGAYTVATLLLARTWHIGLVEWLGAALFVLLLGFWLTVTARTLRAIRTGQAWRR